MRMKGKFWIMWKCNYRRVRHDVAVNERARLVTYYPDSDDDSNDDYDVCTCMYVCMFKGSKSIKCYELEKWVNLI